MNAAVQLRKANEAKAAADAYGTVRLVALSSKTIANGSDPRTVKQILQAMPPNMPQDSAETNQVHRAANKVHGVAEVGYGNYTGCERRAAVSEMVKGKLSFAAAADPLGIYGVPKSALQSDLERLASSLGVSMFMVMTLTGTRTRSNTFLNMVCTSSSCVRTARLRLSRTTTVRTSCGKCATACVCTNSASHILGFLFRECM